MKTKPKSKIANQKSQIQSPLYDRLSETITRIRRDMIDPCPFNPRDDSDIDTPDVIQLAESIREQGIVVPLIIRQHPNKPGRFELIAGERRWLAATRLKLDNVPCRLPKDGNTFTDADAHEIQAIENLQRRGLNLLQEAIGYQQMMTTVLNDDGTAKYPTVEKLALRLGIPYTTITGRLKLLRAPKVAQTAYLRGVLEQSTLLLIARIPVATNAEKATWDVLDKWKQCKTEEDLFSEDRERMSYREAKNHIQGKYMVRIKDVPFDPEDADLVPTAWEIRSGKDAITVRSTEQPLPPYQPWTSVFMGGGGQGPHSYCVMQEGPVRPHLLNDVSNADAQSYIELLRDSASPRLVTITRSCGGACSSCPFRTGNMGLGDEVSPDVCTHTECFKRKKDAVFKRDQAKAKEEGNVLLKDTQGARLFYQGKLGSGSGYIDLDDDFPVEIKDGKKKKTVSWKKALGEHCPEQLVQCRDDRREMHFLLPIDAAIDAAHKAGHRLKKEPSHADRQANQQQEWQRQQAERDQHRKIAMAAVKEAWETINAEINKTKFATCKHTHGLLKVILGTLWTDEKTMPKGKDIAGCLSAITFVTFCDQPVLYNGENTMAFITEAFQDLCKHFKVDLKSIVKTKLKEAQTEQAKLAEGNTTPEPDDEGDDEGEE